MAFSEARAWAERHCGVEPPELLSAQTADEALPAWLELASTRPDDGWQRLANLLRTERREPTRAARIRAELEGLLPQALAARDVAALQLIGHVASSQAAPAELGVLGALDSSMIWALAACDLGADCGPRSVPVRRVCLEHALCGYPDLETAVIDGLWAHGWVSRMQRRRAELVRRLREEGGRGIFDAPVQAPPRG